MRPRLLASTLTAALCFAAPGFAQEASTPVSGPLVEISAQDVDDIDDIVRLPGLVAGGGLIMSFDADDNGRVTPSELNTGSVAAFAVADANQDGRLSALEQQDWANNLPTRDDTLANPVRFDPNLDRMVSQSEFVAVVAQLAKTYADADGDIHLVKLEASEPNDSDAKREWSDLEQPEIFGRVEYVTIAAYFTGSADFIIRAALAETFGNQARNRSDRFGGFGALGPQLDFASHVGHQHQQVHDRPGVSTFGLVMHDDIGIEFTCQARQTGRRARVQPFPVHDHHALGGRCRCGLH